MARSLRKVNEPMTLGPQSHAPSEADQNGPLTMLVLIAILILCGCASRPIADWRPLLAAARQDPSTASTKPESVRRLTKGGPTKSNPIWPIYTFLAAEAYHRSQDRTAAKKAYRELAEWAATDPNHDGWGGSSLAAVALWRWLEALGNPPTAGEDEVSPLLETASKLRGTRLYSRMFSDSIYPSLPQLEEDTLDRLAQLAWSSGRQQEALQIFLRFLSVNRSPDFGLGNAR